MIRFASPTRRHLAVAALVAVTFGQPKVTAYASIGTCSAHGANSVAEACYGGVVQYGTYAEYHNNNMTVSAALEAQGYHINHSIWAYSGSPCTAWVEEGVTQGYHGEIAYEWYWAYNNTSNYYQDFRAGYTSPDGSNHAYRLQYDGGTQYSVWRNGALIATQTGLGYGTCLSAGGLELSGSPTPDFHSDTFDYYPLEWQDTSYNYHVGWDVNQYWADYPCSQYPAGYCMNVAFYGSSHWADNKP